MDLEKKTRALLKSKRRIDPETIDRELIAVAALLDEAMKLSRESKKTDVKRNAWLAAQRRRKKR